MATASAEVPTTSAAPLGSIFSAELEGSKCMNDISKASSPILKELRIFFRQRQLKSHLSVSEALDSFLPRRTRIYHQKRIRDIIDAKQLAVKWELKTYARNNGSTTVDWAQKDDFNTCIMFNKDDWLVPEVTHFTYFDDSMYESYLKSTEWTIEETRYLMHLFRLYSIRWAVIADAYNYPGSHRNVFEIKERIHVIVRCQKYLRLLERAPNAAAATTLLNTDPTMFYNATIDKYNSYIHHQHNSCPPNAYRDFFKRLSEIDLALYEDPVPNVEPPPPSSKPTPVAPSAASSAPVEKAPKNNEHLVKYQDFIELAQDTTALRFFSTRPQGPSLRSQSVKLLSNVNTKKRANIEQVIQHLKIPTNIHTANSTKGHVKLARLITQISELKGLYCAVQNELHNLRKDYANDKNRSAREVKKYELEQCVSKEAKGRSIIKLSETATTVATQLQKKKL